MKRWFRHIKLPKRNKTFKASARYFRSKYGEDYLAHEKPAPMICKYGKFIRYGRLVSINGEGVCMYTTQDIADIYAVSNPTCRRWLKAGFLAPPYLSRKYPGGYQHFYLKSQAWAVIRVLNDIFGQGVKHLSNSRYLTAHREMLLEGNAQAIKKFEAGPKEKTNKFGVIFIST